METHWIVVISVLCTLCVCAQIWLAFYYRGDQYWYDRQSNKVSAEVFFWAMLLIGVPYLLLIGSITYIDRKLNISFFILFYLTDEYYKFSEYGLESANKRADKYVSSYRLDRLLYRFGVRLLNKRFNYPIRIAKS